MFVSDVFELDFHETQQLYHQLDQTEAEFI